MVRRSQRITFRMDQLYTKQFDYELRKDPVLVGGRDLNTELNYSLIVLSFPQIVSIGRLFFTFLGAVHIIYFFETLKSLGAYIDNLEADII